MPRESAAEQAGFRPGWLRKVPCTFRSVFGEPDDFQGTASEENADERDLRGAHRGDPRSNYVACDHSPSRLGAR